MTSDAYRAGPDVYCKMFIHAKYAGSARQALALMPLPYSDIEVIEVMPGDAIEEFRVRATELFGMVMFLTIDFVPRTDNPVAQRKLTELNLYTKTIREFRMDINDLRLVGAPVDMAKQIMPGVAGAYASALTGYAANVLNAISATANSMPGFAKNANPQVGKNAAAWMKDVCSQFFLSYQRVNEWLGGGQRMADAYLAHLIQENSERYPKD